MQTKQQKLMASIWKSSSIIFLLTGLLFSCGGTKKLNEFDIADGYQVSGLNNEMDVAFHSINDSITNLVIKINPDDLLFSKTQTNNHIARYTIGYKVFESYNDRLAIDTAKIYYSLKQEKKPEFKFHRIKILAQKGNDYIVKVTINDENRNFSTSKIFNLRKKSEFSRSFFEISTNNIENNNYTTFQKDSFSIKPLNNQTFTKVQVFSVKNTCTAKPHEVNYKYHFGGIPDTSWIVNLNSNSAFPPLKDQYYHFITDTVKNIGFSVFTFKNTFPKLSSIIQANGALGYLLNKSEYADLLKSANPRKAFENAWLELAGNRQRARNIIKAFYTEVSSANQLFTCNEPGWSTDRGMIYIVYGPPRIVYRNNDSEIWIYGEENNLFSEEFQFRKIHSNISDNIYELKRNINYKVNYNRMINAWIDERGY